jgi:putative transposase
MSKIRKAYKYRLKTNRKTEEKLTRFCGSARFVWNKSLAMNLERLENKGGMLWYHELAFWLRLWKQSEEYGFLKECPSQVLQQKLIDLERAFCDAFDKSQPVEGKVKNITVTTRAGKWYASLQVEQEIEIPRHASDSELGIDAGIKCFAAFSDGTMIEGVNSFRKHEQRLAREQRKLSRKKKGRENWKRQKKKISGIHHTIANVRQDFLHKLSTWISKNQVRVYVEGLNIRGMSASARRTMDAPGRQVRAKSGLNKSILDQGWGKFKRQLDYKLEWQGGELVEVDSRYTSQMCSCCGHVAKENRRSQAIFKCLVCGHEENADINAAKNILTVGQTGMACRANRKSGRQQEPARIPSGIAQANREEVLPVAC